MKNVRFMTTVYERSGPLSDMFVPHQETISLPLKKKMYRSSIAVIALLMTIAVPALFSGGGTGSFFSDQENSTGDTFAAGPLAITVDAVPPGATLFLGQAGQTFTLTVTPIANTLPFRYKVSAAASGNATFCAAVTAVGTAPLAYSGPAASLTTSDTNSLTPWSLVLSLPSPAPGVVDGQLCNLDLKYDAYQEGGAVGTEYHDTQHVVLHLVADPPVAPSGPVPTTTPEPTPTPTPTPEPTGSATQDVAPTPTPTPVSTEDVTLTPTPTEDPTPTPDPVTQDSAPVIPSDPPADLPPQ